MDLFDPGSDPAAVMAAARAWLKDPERVGDRFRLFFEDAPVGMLVTDRRGRVVAANHAIAALLGWSREALSGRPLSDLVHSGDRPRDAAAIEDLLAGRKEAHEEETRFVTSKGSVVHALVRASVLREAGDRVLGGLAQVIDLTPRQRLEAAAKREAEGAASGNRETGPAPDWFRICFEQAPIGMALVGTDGRIVRANPAFCLITGATEEELLAGTFASLTLPEDRDRDTDVLARFLTGRSETFVTEKRTVRRDGHIAWVQLHIAAIHDAGDRLAWFLCQAIDITPRKRAEQVLWEGEERFRAAFEEAPIGMALVAPGGRILRLNRIFAEVLGRSLSSPGRLDLAGTVHPDDRDALLQALKSAAAGGAGRAEGVLRFVGPDGDLRHGRLVLSAVAESHSEGGYLIAHLLEVPATA